jgi:hypothetical protein
LYFGFLSLAFTPKITFCWDNALGLPNRFVYTGLNTLILVNEFQRVWKQELFAYFKALSHMSLGEGWEESRKLLIEIRTTEL